MASKFDQFLKASWNATFRPKSRQDVPAPQIAAEDGVGRGPVGEDLGGGKPETDSQNLGFGSLALEGLRKGQEDLGWTIQHAVPSWAAD